jgi:repressor LexA
MTTGQKIKEARIKKKLTQKKLGEKIGKRNDVIYKYESGERIPKLQVLVLLSNVLECELNELIGDDFF